MAKAVTTRYDVSGHHRTPQEIADCLVACIEEAKGEGDAIHHQMLTDVC
jgi:hypothetical protein